MPPRGLPHVLLLAPGLLGLAVCSGCCWAHRHPTLAWPCAGDENPGRIAADIIFVLQEKPHPVFRRDGNDLIYTHRCAARHITAQHSTAAAWTADAVADASKQRHQSRGLCCHCACFCTSD